jgi:membrane-associated phospholipid phosphatase
MKRFATSTELVIFAYVAAMSAIVIAARPPLGGVYLGYHALVVGMILAVAYADRRYGGRFWTFVRCWLPIYVIAASFRELHYLVPAVHPFDDQGSDLALMELDRLLFGDVYAKVRMLWWRPFVEFLHYCYWMYFPMPVFLMAALYRQGRLREFRHAATALLTTFYAGYLIYIAIPAVGPHHFERRAPELDGVLLGGAMHRALLALEWRMPDAFPSLHTAIAALTLVLCRRYSPRLFRILLVPGIGLILATFVLRYHYVIDVVAGLALVPVAYAIGTALHRAWERAD